MGICLSLHYCMMRCEVLRRFRTYSDFRHQIFLQGTVVYRLFGHNRLYPGILCLNFSVREYRYSSYAEVCIRVRNVLFAYFSCRLCAIKETVFVRLMQHDRAGFYTHPSQQIFLSDDFEPLYLLIVIPIRLGYNVFIKIFTTRRCYW